ncbi:MAG: tetratricopeptide repeat protein [Kiritimatiellae bacterium]|nr:tetratricopeptide repeat protein [Kiritimatiellia bacterium]
MTIAHWPKWTTLLILSACLLIQSAGAEEAQDGKDAATAAKDWVEKARGAVADNDMQTALEYLKQGLAEYPDNFALRSELGTVCLGMGSPDKAIAIWEDLQIKNNRDPSIKNNLAWIYATETDPKIRNPEKAVVLAREALQLLPLSHQVWNTLTTAYHAKGDYTFAAYTAERTVELAQADGAPPEEIEELQKQLRANRQLAEAVAPSVTEALANQNSEQEEFWTKTGQYELKKEHPREALAAFGIARSYNPNSRGARFGEAGIYLFLKQYRKGLDILEQLALEYPNEFAIKNNIAWVYATAENVTIRDANKAIAYAQDALLLSPDSYNVWSTLAEAHFMAGNYERSLRAAETALRQAQLSKATPPQIQGYQRQLARAQRAAEAMSLVE